MNEEEMKPQSIASHGPTLEEQMAHHEAGHAVVAWARSVRLHKLHIGMDRGQSIDWHGFRLYDPAFMSAGDWNHAKTKALILLAGEFSERGLHDVRGTSCDDYASAGDRQELNQLLESLFAGTSLKPGYSMTELESEADQLIVEHWDRIERLAQALMVKHEMSGIEAEAIIRSI